MADINKYTAKEALNKVIYNNASINTYALSEGLNTVLDDANDRLNIRLEGGTVDGNLIITGGLTVEGATTVIESTTLSIDDKNIDLASTDTPSDATADGGGITLKGTSDKTILWDNTNDNWTFNQAVNIATGLDYKINNVSVLNATTLGSGVTASSLTSVGTLTALTGGTGDFNWDSNTLVVDSSESRVGIGVAAPNSLLHLERPANDVGGAKLTIDNPHTGDSDYGSTIAFQAGTGVNGTTDTNIGNITCWKINNSDGSKMRFQTQPSGFGGGATALTIDASQDVTFTGNLVIGTAGKGISFSSTNTPVQSSGTGTSNLLDDYEEGTWTPTMTSAAGTVTVASVTAATYTKIGRIVCVRARIDYSTDASVSTSVITFGGLPFTIKNDGGYSGARLTINNQNTAHNYDGSMFGTPNTTTISYQSRSTSMSSQTGAWLGIDMTYVT